MKKIVLWLLPALLAVLAVMYFSGPKPPSFTLKTILPVMDSDPVKFENELKYREENVLFLKPDNHARIVWADSLRKARTKYCIVYLHGFSASWKEGDPVHRNIAKKFGCNLYLPRLFEHGMQKHEPLLELTAEDYVESARQAVAEARLLGEKVIVMSTSTGGTLSLILAADNPDIEALILYSPNIDLYDQKSFVLTLPWGLQLARRVVKSNYYTFEGNDEVKRYWNTKYRIESLIVLKSLLEKKMNMETFSRVKQPVLLCYYYKDENEQDKIVSVPAMLKMYEQLGTSQELKRKTPVPEAGHHALASGIVAKDLLTTEKATADFLKEVLGLTPGN